MAVSLRGRDVPAALPYHQGDLAFVAELLEDSGFDQAAAWPICE